MFFSSSAILQRSSPMDLERCLSIFGSFSIPLRTKIGLSFSTEMPWPSSKKILQDYLVVYEVTTG